MKWIKRCFKAGVLSLFLAILILLGLYGYAKLSPKLPIKSANALAMYDNTNNLFFQGTGSKEWISLKEISPYLISATISTEDKTFYKHFGFDPLRIAKAFYINFKAGTTKQGASTISQQYAKNLFLDFDKTWERKIEEMWLTIQLEVHYSKQQIIEGYLNTINYGHGMYGIENAAKFYFNKSAKNLDLAEAAMLTGIPKSPSNYSPLVNPILAAKRQQMILRQMYKNKFISEDELNTALSESLSYVGEKNSVNLNTIMYYQDAVIRELKDISSIPTSYTATGGIRIFTNLDMEAQITLENTTLKDIPSESKLQTASVMLKPETGKIIALVGGRDYSNSQFNRAVQSKRQVGSTMKPYLYYAALDNGFTSSSTFMSEETTFTFSNNKTYSPQNYGGTYAGKPISLATAIAYSDNIYAVKTHMFLGENALVNTLKSLGITANLQAIPSLPLGTAEINIMEMAAGYAAFANQGYLVKPHLINRVEDLAGNILYEYKETIKQVLDPNITFILSELLTTTYDSMFIDYSYPTAINIAPKLTHKFALKSGTTDVDHWSIGYNRDIVTAVWIGYDDSSKLAVSDYKYSRNIWADTVEGYLKDSPDNWYTIPSNVVGILVNPITGRPATKEDKKRKIMYYIKGSEPNGTEPAFDEITKAEEP
ncbi:MAG: PBP1A family penicillin-binding protein [Bacilli bacterium]